jgi:hypothetical protein
MLNLLHLYPNAVITERDVTIDIFDDSDITVYFDLDNLNTSSAWNSSHKDLTENYYK